MSEDLQKENEALRNRVKELEQEVEQWKQTLEKYKESCRFQMQQLVDYNQSLKDQLMNLDEYSMNKTNDHGEFVAENVDRFTNLVFSPSSERKDMKLLKCIDNIHQSNIISVIPWDGNDYILFSTDAQKNLICSQWFEDDKAKVLCKISLSAPCCALTTLYHGSILLAGCMDGKLFVFSVEQQDHVITNLKVIEDVKLHEKAILRFRKEESMNCVLSTSYDNTVCFFDISQDGKVNTRYRYYFHYTCDAICICPKHQSIIIAERNQDYINYISIETQEKIEVPINHDCGDQHVSFCITDLQLMHDEDYIIALTDKGNIIVYPYGENTHLQEIHAGSMLSDSYYNGCIAIDDIEKNIIAICADNKIRVFSLYSGKEVQQMEGHKKTVEIRNMFYKKDLHSVLYTCSYDHSICIWVYFVCFSFIITNNH